ncbi:MAG: HesA/MoeB/ThiF family protein [Pseudomonadota bacterium]
MVLVVLFALAFWMLGRWLRVPVGRRWLPVGLLFATIALFHLTLPADHVLRQATGGNLRNWGVVALLAAIAVTYWFILSFLRARARRALEPPAASGPFTGTELDRYARHIVLREIGGPGQKRLKNAKVLVIGAGGLGSSSLLYLAAAGVGTIGVVDDDTVDLSNLQRQIIHRDDDIGLPKVFSAQSALRALNPFVEVRPYRRRLTPETAGGLIADYDLVLDGCDNFDTRYLVNAVCVALDKPLIAGAMTQWEGQISLYHPAQGAPCYACVFPQRPAPGLAPTCAEAGIIAPLPGVIGSMMALEAVKHIAGAGEGLAGRMLIYDALYAETRRIKMAPRPDCPVCRKEA